MSKRNTLEAKAARRAEREAHEPRLCPSPFLNTRSERRKRNGVKFSSPRVIAERDINGVFVGVRKTDDFVWKPTERPAPFRRRDARIKNRRARAARKHARTHS